MHSRTYSLLLLLVTPLSAQTNAERMANDRYSRSHDYDLVTQRITLGAFNWDSLSFDGKVTTTLRALRPGLDSIILDAGTLLDIHSVRDPRGATLRSSRHGDTLVVYPGKPLRLGDTTGFTIAYHGVVSNGDGLTFIEADSGHSRRPRQIWSQGEDHNNHLWFPTYDFPNDKMTWSLAATVPRGFTAVSNGKLVTQRTNADGTRTFTWSQTRPSATYLVSLIVAPLVRLRDTWRGIPVDYYVYREDSTLARPLFRVTPDMIEVFSRLTGVRYPWDKYAQTTVADFFGGMENVSATTLVDWLPDARAYADHPWFQEILIPHELAHQWFGDYVTTANWANMWLNEGFAEFMPGQYWGEKLGHLAEDNYYVDEYRQFMDIDRRKRMPLAALASNNIYPKGALVLRMLEQYLGRERFWASVKYYLERHALGVAVTDDFRQAVLAATGENIDWFMDEWFYQAGYPEFDVQASWDSASHSVTLQVKQTQVDSSKADSTGLRYTTPSAFRMPVTVRVGTAEGDIVRRFQLDAREQTLTVDGVASAPTMVVFDDGNTILKRLDFQQPTAWLAAQLEKDADLWNRQWVTQQLAGRSSDPAAGQALARAVGSADYDLVRLEALKALARFPPDISRGAVQVALRDTSARVRALAYEALGVIGGPDALASARQAFEQDPSWEVRAAALTAQIGLDSANSQELIRRGLATPSYRDAIQNAALGVIVERNDSSMVADLERIIGDQPNPAFALAALAGRGAGGALAALIGHLADARPLVRHFSQQAFEFGMEPGAALEALRGAQASLTSDRARSEVSKLIERLERRAAREGKG